MLRILCLIMLSVSLAAGTAEDADRLMDQAVKLMEAANDDSSKSVDAAVLLVEARDIYQELGDWENVREANAYIFYCKKKMNIHDLDRYVERTQSNKQDAEKAIAVVDTVVNEKIDGTKAQEYFKAAESFASAYPESHFKIHMRYLEVAERFADANPSVASKATRLSSEALQAWSKTLKKEERIMPETVFLRAHKKTTDLFGQAKGSPSPDEDSYKDILKQLKKEHKEKFRSKKRHQFATWLFDTALKSQQDKNLAFVLANEAAEVACDRKVLDISLMMKVSTFLSSHYSGPNEKDRQIAYLNPVASAPLVKQALLLLESPDDAEANTAMGMNFCFVGQNWPDGLPLLAAGVEGEWKRVAQMEEIKASTTGELLELADLWFDLAQEREAKSYKIAILQRALKWYQKSFSDLDGLVKDRIAKRIEQIKKLVPFDPSNLDFDNLTADEWDLIPGKSKKCMLANPRNKLGLKLKEGEEVRVVPHPTDEWGVSMMGGMNQTATYKGINMGGGAAGGRRGGGGFGTVGNMEVYLSDDTEATPVAVGIVAGPGEIFIGGSIPRRPGLRAVGDIRVKVMRIGLEW